MNAPTRPAVRWHGGKWRLAPWIIAHFPPHRVYVEPFGGGGSVLLRKARTYAEVYNDLDGDAVNLFRVLRDPETAAELRRRLELTPYSRAEFQAAYGKVGDPVQRAAQLIVRAFMGHGSDGAHSPYRTGFRANSNQSSTTPARDWRNYPAAIPAYVERLRGVVVENRSALDVMAQHDGSATLHYVDPPYIHDTRARSGRRPGGQTAGVYAHEMSDADHSALLAALQELAGMVVLSGYPHPLYDEALTGWRRVETEALADGARKRTEVLWLNPACVTALDAAQVPLIAEVVA